MRVLLTALAIAGGVMPIVAVIWGWLSIRSDYHKLVRDLDAIDVVIQAPQGTYASGEEQSEAMYAIRAPMFNVGRATFAGEWTQRLILKQAMDDLRGPAWLAGGGLLLSTVAGVWSLWL